MHLAYPKTISLKCPVRLYYANRLFDVFIKNFHIFEITFDDIRFSYIGLMIFNLIEKESRSHIKNLKHFRIVKFENIFQYCTCKKE